MKRKDLEIGKIYYVRRGQYGTGQYVRLLAMEDVVTRKRIEAIQAERGVLRSYDRKDLAAAKRNVLVERVYWGDRDFYTPGPASEVAGAFERPEAVTLQSIRSEWTDETYAQMVRDKAEQADLARARAEEKEEIEDLLPRLNHLLEQLGFGENAASVRSLYSRPHLQVQVDLNLTDVKELLGRYPT